MAYQDLDTIQHPSGGAVELSQWGGQVNDNIKLLAGIRLYRCSVQCNASQNINNSVDTLVAFDAIINDPNSNFSAVTHLYTVPVTSVYDIKASVVFNGGSAQGFIGLYRNATSGGPQAQGMRFPMGVSQGGTAFWTIQLTAGDTIGIDAWQNSGAAQTLLGAASRMSIQIWPF